MSMLRTKRGASALSPGAILLADRLAFELVPLKSLEAAVQSLPAGSRVSVTCSPNKGIAVTQQLTEQLLAAGHQAVPHVSARMVEGPAHATALARWMGDAGVREVFVVGGDADPPAHYTDGASFLADFLAAGPSIDAVGVPAYPDGHASISSTAMHEALHAKQALIAEAGLAGWASTQMCFDAAAIVSWLRAERAAGLTLPVHLGIPGVVDRAKLMSLGVRLGIGQSLRYLSKNRASVTKMLMPGGYDPTSLIKSIGTHATELGVTGTHCFTFNAVAETAAWREAILAG